MTNLFSLHPVFATLPVWAVMATLIALGIFLIGGEIKRQRAWLGIRIIAQVFVVTGLLGLFLRPSYVRRQQDPKILLLTKGYSRRIADSLIQKNPSLKIMRADTGNDGPALSPVGGLSFVLGEGLPESTLDHMPDQLYLYYPDSAKDGVTELTSEPAVANHRTIIRGGYYSKEPGTLVVAGPGGPEDSVNLAVGKNDFALAVTPKLPGQFVYSLQKKTGAAHSRPERFPLDVREPRKLHVLFLVSYPEEEVRYLKNYLSDHGHDVLVRYQVSKNIFRYESANGPVRKIDRLTPGSLTPVDLLIADENVLRGMGTTEKKILAAAIDDGLGMLVLPEGETSNGQEYPGLALDGRKQDTATFPIRAAEKITLPIVTLPPQKNDRATIVGVHGKKILSKFQNQGLGKIGVELLQETYSFVLNGQGETYAAVWSPLLEEVARLRQEPFTIRITSRFPTYANKSVAVEIISSGTTPSLLADGIPIALTEDVRVDDVWHATIWNGRPGWHELMIPQDSTRLPYYIPPQGEWQTLAHAHQVAANQTRNAGPSPVTASTPVQIEVSRWFFFFLFLAGSGFLWLAPKL